MVRIADSNGTIDGNYADLFGDDRLAFLGSQIQSAVIRQGHHLERTIHQMIPRANLSDLIDVFAGHYKNPVKDIIIHPKLPKSGESAGIVSDFAVFNHRRREVHVIELKYGYQHDTQKSRAIKENLQTITTYLSQHTHYTGKFYVCPWSAPTVLDAVTGLKHALAPGQIMLARDFCRNLEIDFHTLVDVIIQDRAANRCYIQAMVAAVERGVSAAEYFTLAEEFKTGQTKMRFD